jgi:hypothetical protein
VSVQLETEVDEVGGDDGHFWSRDVTTEKEATVGSGELEAVDREEGSPVGLVDILAERGDLTGGSHL